VPSALLALVVLGIVSVAALPGARAADGTGAVSPLFLDLLAPRPIESHESALNRSLREAGPAPRPSLEGHPLPDGSVRYGEGRGSVVVTVRQGGSGSGSGVGNLGRYPSPSGLGTR
jgi:hypothetical protein